MPGINEQIKAHALESEDWRHNTTAKLVYQWFDKFNETLFAGKLPQAVIGFSEFPEAQKANVPRDVVYHYEGDDISVHHHIDIRAGVIGIRLVMALLKGMVLLSTESYQDKKSWYWSVTSRATLRSFGIMVDEAGDWVTFLPKLVGTIKLILEVAYPPKILLKTWTNEYLSGIGLADHAEAVLKALEQEWDSPVEEEEAEEEEKVQVDENGHVVAPAPKKKPTQGLMTTLSVKDLPKANKGSSKMKKWGCDCTIVRCATNLTAGCLKCGKEFELKD